MAVRSALQQTRSPLEVIVIADGCTDGTVEALEASGDDRVVALDMPKGPGYGYVNRNQALCRARGDVVAWLGDDDLYLPDHLERIGQLYDTLDVDLVQAATCTVDSSGNVRGRLPNDWRVPAFREMMLGEGKGVASASVSHRRQPALDAGGWRHLPRRGDRDLWQRMLLRGARTVLSPTPTVLVLRPVHLTAAEQIAFNACFLERMEAPLEAARLQAEMTRAIHEHVADVWVSRERAKRQVARLKATRDRRRLS